jgi:hypothetical protein
MNKMNEPQIIKPNPRKIIPYHYALPKLEFYTSFVLGNLGSVPPIPVFEAPDNLKKLGDFVNYNGHKRTASAIAANVHPRVYFLKSLSDLLFLAEKKDCYDELMQGLDLTFETHKKFVCDEAVRYAKLTERM